MAALKIITLALLNFLIFSASAQPSKKSTFDLLLAHSPTEPSFYSQNGENSTDFLAPAHPSFFLKLGQFAAGPLLYFYQNVLSGQISSGCNFETTCANYGKIAFSKYGPIRATLATIDRLYRCNSATYRNVGKEHLNLEGKIVEKLP